MIFNRFWHAWQKKRCFAVSLQYFFADSEKFNVKIARVFARILNENFFGKSVRANLRKNFSRSTKVGAQFASEGKTSSSLFEQGKCPKMWLPFSLRPSYEWTFLGLSVVYNLLKIMSIHFLGRTNHQKQCHGSPIASLSVSPFPELVYIQIRDNAVKTKSKQ